MRFRSISRKFRHFCISFASGLLLTFLLSQVLLQYLAHWSEQTLHTQEIYSLYWNVIGELDNSLYIISQTPTEELTDEAQEMSGKLLEYASLLEKRFGDSRGRDLRILTEHLNREMDGLDAAKKEEISAAADEAQARIQVLCELYEGFYESMETYLRSCQHRQITVRLNVSLVMLLAGAVLILFFAFQSGRLSRQVLAPVLALTAQARSIIAGEECGSLHHMEEPSDELGVLNNAFYEMVETNRSNMERIRRQGELETKLANARADNSELQAKLDRIRLRLLRSRVNPHFMFNILNIIAGLAVEEDAVDTARFTVKTASYFRYSLVSLDQIVKLKDEMENVRLYLEIQKMRFRNRIDWEISLPEEYEQIQIPSMILQPLCENAIVHGMASLTRPIGIRLSAGCEREKIGDLCSLPEASDIEKTEGVSREVLVIAVVDDGAGIVQETLERLRIKLQNWQDYSETEGIGLANTFQRLQIFCGGKASCQISSRPGEYTKVAFRIPMQESEGEEYGCEGNYCR